MLLHKYPIVLILIVVEDGLVPALLTTVQCLLHSLNPYCSGRWSRTVLAMLAPGSADSLNPYCSGRWSRTHLESK